jgi:hypothetical protein
MGDPQKQECHNRDVNIRTSISRYANSSSVFVEIVITVKNS